MPTEELLTSEELSALLPETPADEAAAERERRSRVVPYNFRRPDRLSKEDVRALYLLHDTFAHNLSSGLPLFLRAASEVTLISVEQRSYSDYLRGLPDPTTLFTVAARPMQGMFIAEISSSIAFPIIDRMLGGEGRELDEVRPATELELKVLEGFLTVMLSAYRDAWKSHCEMETEIVARETRPQMLQIVAPNEVVAAVSYQIQIGESRGAFSVCLPVALLEPVIDSFSRSAYAPDSRNQPEATAALLSAVGEVRFTVACEMEPVAISLAELNSISPGDVIRTNHPVDRPLTLSVGGSPKFSGRLAALEGKMVAQVTDPANPAAQ